MLRRPQPTKERVEPTILSVIAIDISHLTRFTFLLLIRIQRYLWRNHIITWANVISSDMNFDLNNIWVTCLHFISECNFWIGFEKLK